MTTNKSQWYIKVFRSFLQWERYDEEKTMRVFLHLLLTANHQDKKRRWQLIKRWQILTSHWHLAKELRYTIQNVRTVLNNLKSTWEINVESTNKNTMITLINYEKYQQRDDKPTTKPTIGQQAPNEQPTTNNNEKNERMNNIYIHRNSKNIITHKKITTDIEKAINKAWRNYTDDEIIRGIDNYAQILFSEDTERDYKRTLSEFLSRENALPVMLYKSPKDYPKRSNKFSITDDRDKAADEIYNKQPKRVQEKLKTHKPPGWYRNVAHLQNHITPILEKKL